MNFLLSSDHNLDAADVVKFGTTRFWAERGLIHWEDSKDNSYGSMSVRDALERARAISAMIKNSRREANSPDMFDKALVEKHQNVIEGMVRICQKAKEQGMPTDASARRELARRKPLTVVVDRMF